LVKLLSAVPECSGLQFYIRFLKGKSIRLQTLLWAVYCNCSDTTSSPYTRVFVTFCDVNNVVYKELFLILIISLKRNQALLRSNLPAIRLMLIR